MVDEGSYSLRGRMPCLRVACGRGLGPEAMQGGMTGNKLLLEGMQIVIRGNTSEREVIGEDDGERGG
jgi:hypothetical protein